EGFGDQIMGFTKSSIQVELIWATTPGMTARLAKLPMGNLHGSKSKAAFQVPDGATVGSKYVQNSPKKRF
ncbi:MULTISPECIES: hypothetical protein, partial [unclassified Aeromonas]